MILTLMESFKIPHQKIQQGSTESTYTKGNLALTHLLVTFDRNLGIPSLQPLLVPTWRFPVVGDDVDGRVCFPLNLWEFG